VTRIQIERLIAEIENELAHLERIEAQVKEAHSRFGDTEPGGFEMQGVALVLHDFYNAAENMFKRIAIELGEGLPQGGDWHAVLLRNMTLRVPTLRPPVIQDATASTLDEFRRFRHRVRHAYGFTLRWSTLRGLLAEFDEAYQSLVADVRQFVTFLKEMAEAD
jgi:hypothetical protein